MYLHILAYPFKYQNTYNSSNAVMLVNPSKCEISTSNIPFLETSPSLPWQRWLCLCSVHHRSPTSQGSPGPDALGSEPPMRLSEETEFSTCRSLRAVHAWQTPPAQFPGDVQGSHAYRLSPMFEWKRVHPKKQPYQGWMLPTCPGSMSMGCLFWSHFATVQKAWMIERRSSALCDNSIPSSIGNNVKQPR